MVNPIIFFKSYLHTIVRVLKDGIIKIGSKTPKCCGDAVFACVIFELPVWFMVNLE